MLTGTASVTGILVDVGVIIAAMAAGIGWLWKKIRRRLVEPVSSLATEVTLIKREFQFNGGSTVKDNLREVKNTQRESAAAADLAATRSDLILDRIERGQVKNSRDIAVLADRLDNHIDNHRS